MDKAMTKMVKTPRKIKDKTLGESFFMAYFRSPEVV